MLKEMPKTEPLIFTTIYWTSLDSAFYRPSAIHRGTGEINSFLSERLKSEALCFQGSPGMMANPRGQVRPIRFLEQPS